MPRKSIGETAMTDAERQARYRAAHAAGKPVVRVRRALDHRGRARRWTDHVAGLVEAQVEYAAWLDSLPNSLQEPPARRCVGLSMGTPRRAGPPYGLPAQATTQGGQFWTPIGVNIQRRLTPYSRDSGADMRSGGDGGGGGGM